MNAALRASDDDRQRVLTALEEHTAAGRLRLDEFDDRVSATLSAVTLGDLAAVTTDLPEVVVTAPASGAAPVVASDLGASARPLLVAFVLAVMTLMVLGGVLALAR